MEKVPEEIYNRINNEIYDQEGEKWWQPDFSVGLIKTFFNPVRVGYAKKVFDYYQLFYSLFYEMKLKEVPKLSSTADELLHKEHLEFLSKNSEYNIVAHYLAQIVLDIYKNNGILFTMKGLGEENK